MNTHFDIIVIGKGLVGSAAAKYLSQNNNAVAVIGPDEPENYNDATVFASHYDQARVQRVIGRDPDWTKLNLDSIDRYQSIQQHSGIQFYHPVGCLYVNPYGTDDYLEHAQRQANTFKQSFKRYSSGEALALDFPTFSFPSSSHGLYEHGKSGFINPRLLLKAQLVLAKQHNVSIFTSTVSDITDHGNGFVIYTNDGKTYHAQKVLLAMGSFINSSKLLSEKIKLVTKSEVVLLIKMTENIRHALSNIPSLLYEIDNGDAEGLYMTPPVTYPDGEAYLKVGCNSPYDIFFDSIEQVQDWFRKGDTTAFMPALVNALKSLMPELPIEEYYTKKCIISRTPNQKPIISESIQKGLFVAGGCNGYSAMCSDAIGSVASDIVNTGIVPAGFSKNAFLLEY